MIICVIPARGGSKRIPRKNIKEFNGKPIIAYSIEAAFESNCFDQVIVSTDDNEIKEVAKKYGAGKSILLENIEQFDEKIFKNINSIGLTASASAPEILVQNFIELLEKKFDVELIQDDFIKEDVNFKIPQKLKEAI